MAFRIALQITDDREEALLVDIQLANEHGNTLWIYSAGLTTDEAIERAEEELAQVFGGEWTYQDWRAA